MQQRVKGRPLLLEQVAQVNIDLSLDSDNTRVHVIIVTTLELAFYLYIWHGAKYTASIISSPDGQRSSRPRFTT